MNEKVDTTLISKDYFPKEIKIDETKIFPMVVVATMSSGKSTLINALLGKEILPSSNRACTALRYSILDDDGESQEVICVTNVDGTVKVIKENLAKELETINDSDSVENVFLKAHIGGVLNTDKALLVADTPGPNNSSEESHEKALLDTLDKVNGGMILYVLNASQIGIYDDRKLLKIIKVTLDKKPKLKVVFALNKIDVLDEEYESVEEMVRMARDYIVESGFDNVDIIPVSAVSALLFKKVLAGDKLTRRECAEFESLYELFEPRDYNMHRYALTEKSVNQNNVIEMNGNKYKVADLCQAVENTGITLLEKYIQKAQILSSEPINNKVKVKITKEKTI